MLNSVLKIIRGIIKLRGDTDGTLIGNDGDALKVTTSGTSTANAKVEAFIADSNFPDDQIEPPRLSRYGAQWVSLAHNEFGAPVFMGPNGVLNAEGIVRLIGDNFVEGNLLLTEQWNFTATNGGTQSVVDGELILATNGTANGKFTFETRKQASFVTATFNFSHLAIAMPNPDNTDVIREWGVFDPDSGSNDGVTFRNVSGTMFLRRYKNGTVIEDVTEASWNGVGKDRFTLDNKIKIYEIYYNAGTIFFVINGALVHKMSAPTSAAYGTPHLKAGGLIENINGNTTANSLVSRGFSVSRIGSRVIVPRFKHITTTGTFVIKNTPGQLERITINDFGTGQSRITAYDNDAASGETIFEIDSNDVNGTLEYGMEFDALTIVTTGGFIDITIVYF